MREQKSYMLKIFIRVVACAPELELSFIFYWKRFQEKKIALIWVKGSVSKKNYEVALGEFILWLEIGYFHEKINVVIFRSFQFKGKVENSAIISKEKTVKKYLKNNGQEIFEK